MASGFPQAVEQGLREPAPRRGEGLADGLGDSLAVAALAVSAEDVERLEAGERLARRLEPQERVDADRLVGRAEVADGAERVADDEDPLRGEPKRHLLPEPAADDRDHLERRVGHSVEGRHVERDAEAARDGRTVALVAVEELDDASRLAELR